MDRDDEWSLQEHGHVPVGEVDEVELLVIDESTKKKLFLEGIPMDVCLDAGERFTWAKGLVLEKQNIAVRSIDFGQSAYKLLDIATQTTASHLWTVHSRINADSHAQSIAKNLRFVPRFSTGFVMGIVTGLHFL